MGFSSEQLLNSKVEEDPLIPAKERPPADTKPAQESITCDGDLDSRLRGNDNPPDGDLSNPTVAVQRPTPTLSILQLV